MWSVDGCSWDIPCTIERTAELTASEVSGMLLNKQYFNDVIGTFMQYSVAIAIPRGRESDYKYIYEILTNPVDAHTFVLPYNDNYIQITGRVQTVSDKYYRNVNGNNGWRGTKFNVIANHPSKEMSLSQVIQRGISPLPTVQHAADGDVYGWNSGAWTKKSVTTGNYYYYNSSYNFEPTSFTDGDSKEY